MSEVRRLEPPALTPCARMERDGPMCLWLREGSGHEREDSARKYNRAVALPLRRPFALVLIAAAFAALEHTSFVATATNNEADAYLGILDDAREDLHGESTEAIERRLVMPAFEERSGEWRAISHFWVRKVKWTVAFDGKSLGEVDSRPLPMKATK
jgi:hypothetical protein